MSFKIALVGCGNLGSRHLQGLKKTQRDIMITVCEPSENSRNIAIERYAQIEDSAYVKRFHVLEDYHELEQDYDLAIVATNAVNRYEIASWIIENLKIRYLILEKVVFQTIDEFDQFEKKVNEQKIKTWVNCARRMYPFYQELRPIYADEESVDMYVRGGNWGMGSNTIHMVDLYYYLTGFSQYEYDGNDLEKQMQESKRSGYQEFYGELRLITDKGKLLINCSHEESAFLHKAVLKIFLDHINRYSKEEVKRCPIT